MHLGLEDPWCLVLSADFRLSHPNFSDDQTWNLSLRSGEPPALALATSFGLRARLMRFFPRFIRKATDITDPASFFRLPIIRSIHPNHCQVEFWPFAGIEINADYLVIDSSTTAGRIQFLNHNILAEKFTFEWASQLIPLSTGEGIQLQQRGAQNILYGACENLSFTCSSAQKTHPGKGPYPALAYEVNLPPSNQTEFTWQCVTQPEKPGTLAETRISIPSFLTRTALVNESETVEIETGDQDWDVILGLSQVHATREFFPENDFLPNPSFVLCREPDFGYSNRGDGSDHPFLWSGQTVFDSYYLSGFLLPGGASHLCGVIDNFLHVQTEDGRIDWRPGFAGRFSRSQAQPMLASLAWKVYQSTMDKAWLEKSYPGLLRFFLSWMAPELDRDKDGLPEWSSPLETALEDNLLYNRRHPQTDGWEVSFLRAPSLASMLFGETKSLLRIAQAINDCKDLELLDTKSVQLNQAIRTAYQDKFRIYQYQDGANPAGRTIGQVTSLKGSGQKTIHRKLKAPSRLILSCRKSTEATRAGIVHITGLDAAGSPLVEEIVPRSWVWSGQHGTAITQSIFSSVDLIDRNGFESNDQLIIQGADFRREDISLLLALWAGAVDPVRAKQLITQTIPEGFLQPFGLVDFLDGEKHPVPDSLQRVSFPWNSLILEGYLNYGFRSQAAGIYMSLMEATAAAMKTEKAYFQYYHPKTGAGLGQRNHLHGLPSPGLFLQIAGIHQIGENHVLTRDFNAFPFTVTVKYHGMKITSKTDCIEIVFPGGQLAKVDSPGFHRVNLTEPGHQERI